MPVESVAGPPEVPDNAGLARSLGGDFRSEFADVNGTRLHYVVGGSGEPVVLLHGWPETWWAYRKLIPLLAGNYRVIAVDHRGIGIPDEQKPADGFTKKNMARDVYELIRSLGYGSAHVVGHDMGAMVAYSFAANHPEATRRLTLLDVVHPDETYYGRPMLRRPNTGVNMWWMAFNQVRGLPEQVFAGRGWYLIDWLYSTSLIDQESVTPFDRAVYARAYDHTAVTRATNGYYQAYHQDIEDLKGYPKVTAPLLAMAAPTQYDQVRDQLAHIATDVRMVRVDNSLHWLAEDAPDLVARELLAFLAG